MSKIKTLPTANCAKNVTRQRRSRFAPTALVIALSSVLAMPGAANATDWGGNMGTSWFVGGNWTAGVPTAGTPAIIDDPFSPPVITGAGNNGMAGSMTIGDANSGQLLINNGGTLTSGSANLGNQAGSSGTVVIDGMGTSASWDITGLLQVGSSGTGNLTVQGGGTLTNTNIAFIGRNQGSIGSVTISGSGSKWTNSNTLAVGSFGNGTLTISGGGQVTNATASLGSSDGSSGVVTVDGLNSSWSSTALEVGGIGTGVMSVTGNATASATDIRVGVWNTGEITVDGNGSNLTATSSLTVGVNGQAGIAGTGKVTVSNGGTLKSGSANLGNQAGSSGTVVIDGMGTSASWDITGLLQVGSSGTGNLTVQGGGTLTNTNIAFIGRNQGSIGSVTISGSGSKWTNSNTLAVGSFGNGTLTISGGGQVTNATASLGSSDGSSGVVTVDGLNSSWSSTALEVGGIGTGVMSVTGNATASATDIQVGVWNTGEITVDGNGSNLTATGSLTVGANGQTGIAGTGRVTVSNQGAMTTASATLGNQPGSTGTLNVDGNNSTWTNTGDLTVGNAGTGVLNITNFGGVSTAGNLTIGALATGKGTVNVGLNGTLAATAGSVLVNHGLLAVNGAISAGNGVTVNSGGTLTGNGLIVSNVSLAQAGATIAPGNLGTLNIVGNLTQTAGSIHQAELNAANQSSSLIHLGGTADIQNGAILKPVIVGGARPKPGAHYTVLTADAGVTGTYTFASANTAFLGFSASYDANNVYLDVTKSASFGSVGLTRNQIAAGNAADALGSGNAVFDAVLNSATNADARLAFDQLSGEVHASARSVLMQDSHFMRDASLERLRALDSESVANDGGADPQEGKQARLLPSARDLAYWARAMGSWGHIDGDGNAATVKRDTSGFLMGADTRFGEEGRFGLMGGYSRSAFDVADRNSSGSSDNYHLGAYAGSRWGDLALRTGISYSWHDVSTSRRVAFPGFTDSLKADYKASTTQAFAELGYRIKTERAEFEPFANLAHVNISSDGFTERGGAAALTSGGASKGVTFGTLGIRASTKVGLANGADVTARGSLGWRTASGDTTPATTLAFAGGSQFAIAGAPIAKNAAVVEAGLDFRLTSAATLGLSWAGQFGSGVKDKSARINLNVAF